MYTPAQFEMAEEACWPFIDTTRFGLLLSQSKAQLLHTYLPFVSYEREGQRYLSTHLARANPQAKFTENQEVEVLFQGPHAYISPAWYLQHPSVPTWNYAAVEVHGKVRLIHDPQEKLDQINDGIAVFDPGFLPNMKSLPADYIEGLLRAVVVLDIEVTAVHGKAKMSQNKNKAEREQIIAQLIQSEQKSAQMTGEYMLANPQLYHD